jgi:ribonuclease BN (tRNA processing enzyme)
MIRFHILGAGGATPMPGHSPAAYHVRLDETPILMDPGPGALVRLVSAGLAPRGVDDIGLVLLTHLHPDHCLDLIALLFALHSPLPERTDPLRLWGPPGLEDWLEQLRGIWGRSLAPRRRELVVRELAAGDREALPGGGNLETFLVDHPQDRWARACHGYRFADAAGHTAVFSGDTGPCPGLTAAARGADLLVVECSTTDELATPGHMTPTGVGRLCAEARPGRVVLTHMYPPAAEADLAALVGAHTTAPVLQARDGTVVTVPAAEGDTT